MRIKSAALVLAASILPIISAGVAHAEIVSTPADLQNDKRMGSYMTSPPMIETMRQFGKEMDGKLGLQADCKSNYNITKVTPVIVMPVDFPADKQNPISGVWQSRYLLERCGESKDYNAIFIANKDAGTPKSVSFYPGSTIASPVLVKDAMQVAVIAAMAKSDSKDCRDIFVFDMVVDEQPHDLGEGDVKYKGVWSEVWTLLFCGKKIDVPMHFTPDANGGGTSFRTGAATVKE